MQRVIGRIHFNGSKNEFPAWNPAFGEVMKNKYHRREEAKERGWVEVGTEKLPTIEREMAKTKEHNWKERWRD